MKEGKAAALALGTGCLLAFLLLEALLRIFNPFGFRLKGEEIILPAGKVYKISRHAFSKLDPVILHTKNSLGFRGSEPVADPEQALGIITIGGSTTECFYLSDGTTWPDRLDALLNRDFSGVWLNNAGLDGHSTYGHLLLLKQHVLKLKPKVAVFLVGLNDLGRPAQAPGGWFSRLASHSAVLSMLENLSRFLDAKRKGLVHKQLDIKALPQEKLSSSEENAMLLKYESGPLLKAYAERLDAIVELCRSNAIEPVFLTQPALYGPGIDPQTGTDLASVKAWEGNGEVSWKIMDMYNDVVRGECRSKGLLCVDLARSMPKDSAYYYDFYHFTVAGAEKVADIVYHELKPFLERRYGAFRRTRGSV
ncbi:MAG: hypothetical protein GX410_11015 [Elusimicrobia bacterium]|nr:hypothetical protein [Elusimicrobiota bacterium]